MNTHIARSRKDVNHNEIAGYFRALGCSVAETVSTGIPGFPDLVVGCLRVNHLIEIKNPNSVYGKSGLNDNQTAFNRDWRGERMASVSTQDDVIALVNRWRRP